jgi:threonylcarbamoyladenosine tRNA methylthiotransferase MtaB
MKKVALHTLGCKLNFSETSTIGRQFLERGYTVVGADETADVFVLNTCSVTERADRDCRQIIRRTLRSSPETYIIVTGCYAQLRPEEIAAMNGVDLILGTAEKFNIFRHEENFAKRSVPQQFVSCIDDVDSFDTAFSAGEGGRTRAFLKIQDGCDYSCAFCTIPLARGSSRSQDIASIIGEANTLASLGFREIVLTGVNVGDYGRHAGSDLLRLLQELEQVEGIDRFRVSSVEPNLLSKELIAFMIGSEKYCNHFHIPLQSGSDAVLRAMRRRYTTAHYRGIVETIRSMDPSAGIGADVIVGFPGETAGLYDETHTFLADLPVSYLHVFTYSEREHTPAAELADAVEPRVRQQRSDTLRDLGRRKRRMFYDSFVGRQERVLFESAEAGGGYTGLTSQYVRVAVTSNGPLENRLLMTTILGADDERCFGSITPSIERQQGDPLSITDAHNLFAVPHHFPEVESI